MKSRLFFYPFERRRFSGLLIAVQQYILCDTEMIFLIPVYISVINNSLIIYKQFK